MEPDQTRPNQNQPVPSCRTLIIVTFRHSLQVQRRTLNPIYRQNFIFRLPEDEVVHTVVKFTVIGLDRYSHPVHIGQVVHRLSDRDFCLSASDVSVPIWRDIEQSDLVNYFKNIKFINQCPIS